MLRGDLALVPASYANFLNAVSVRAHAQMRDRDRGKEFAVIKFGKIIRDESGASAAEYALILAIIGSVIAVAALGLGNAIGGRMDAAATCISGGTPADCGGAAS